MFHSLPRIALLLSGLFLLAQTARAAHTTHTITITYDATATPQWSYAISPDNDAKNARVKRHDTILWQCGNGGWTVFFKGPTPLADGNGGMLSQVSGAAGAIAGGEVDGKVKKGEEFTYGVSVILPGASEPVVDDPRIIIEN